MFTFSYIIMILTAVTTALISGLFYAWSCSVIPGLARVSDSTYLEAMQQMNRAILNPVFFLSFMGTVLLLPLCTYLQYGPVLSPLFWLLLLASIVYLGGTFGVTMFGNVPLNNMLDAFNLSAASVTDLADMRIKFEQPWIYLHTIRTIANVIALILVVMACVSPTTVAERIPLLHRP
ncbi:DUF1772 domain-containing protein [Chitinophaga pinensis]|uniref:DUF1772 domain-containing protein n=2 Tax=Chitinophaga pinensis TaxID=79329 RepID=A0A5C6LMQ9_9BACT|nr:DUF1772 domain-containing protein [Chitinophaga pinensis]TWV97431.1 DUF1772 domain-containing protein [Chitinophaga pinensis]